jgi:capsular polysaccharide biosynthesis protein
MGGVRSRYHDVLINAVCELYGVEQTAFFFPNERCIHEVDEKLIFFSDQKVEPAHPAQLANPHSIALLRRLLMGLAAEPVDSKKKIFISRADAKLRKIRNESDLIALAMNRGFSVFELTDLPIEVQFGLFRQAEQIVGAHGMGFTHIALHDDRPSILELFHPTIATDAYATISRRLGFGYNFLVGNGIDDGKASYKIHLSDFADALDSL